MLVYKGFIGQIDYNSESHKLVGEVVNSVDLIEFEGESAAEIKENFQQRVDEYLAFQNEVVGNRPTPFVGNFTICLTTEKQNKVIQAAQQQGQSVTHWLNQQIDLHLSQYFDKIA
ncbi:hypothetical protein [Aliikangiella sp. G2MR2-5]|uniref:hypothetical protein n=1 Tax=Aliikangiella sp. G2MR2-5 TaxID=2788943 RepID=UPI0018AA6B56|nr:hypothetical protein [Aliikangiella sp. G2MR2-5]